jgi:hypothetical protein
VTCWSRVTHPPRNRPGQNAFNPESQHNLSLVSERSGDKSAQSRSRPPAPSYMPITVTYCTKRGRVLIGQPSEFVGPSHRFTAPDDQNPDVLFPKTWDPYRRNNCKSMQQKDLRQNGRRLRPTILKNPRAPATFCALPGPTREQIAAPTKKPGEFERNLASWQKPGDFPGVQPCRGLLPIINQQFPSPLPLPPFLPSPVTPAALAV